MAKKATSAKKVASAKKAPAKKVIADISGVVASDKLSQLAGWLVERTHAEAKAKQVRFGECLFPIACNILDGQRFTGAWVAAGGQLPEGSRTERIQFWMSLISQVERHQRVTQADDALGFTGC